MRKGTPSRAWPGRALQPFYSAVGESLEILEQKSAAVGLCFVSWVAQRWRTVAAGWTREGRQGDSGERRRCLGSRGHFPKSRGSVCYVAHSVA